MGRWLHEMMQPLNIHDVAVANTLLLAVAGEVAPIWYCKITYYGVIALLSEPDP